MTKWTRKRDAEFRKVKRDFQDVLDQLLEEEWQRLASAHKWSEEEERKMVAAIRARRRPLSDRKRGTIVDVTGAVDDVRPDQDEGESQ
jgi:hypothetical protein